MSHILPTRTDAPESEDSRNVLHHRYPQLPTSSINLYLFILAFLFSLYDALSTVLCINIHGYDSEANILLRWIMQDFGVAGFVGVKLGVTLIVLVAVYYIITNNIHFGQNNSKKFYGIYLGVILSNAYAGTSNTAVVIKNSSFYFLNLNSMQMVLLLIFIPPIVVLFFDTR
ncbi:MAG: DUF5658 family protein [Euryarchaeota archaeon]|nr:DUF5658 family protein [Euryarchaeota archaeon]